MHICYFDEAGDDGYPIYSAPLFVYTSMYFPDQNWRSLQQALFEIRQSLSVEYSFPMSYELHARAFLTNKKPFCYLGISNVNRVNLVEKFIQEIARLDFRVINVVINKTLLTDETNLIVERALTYAIQRLENDLRINNPDENFMVITDPGHVAKMRKVTSRLRQADPNFVAEEGVFVPRVYGTIDRLIEDPFEKASHQSYFIQCVDVISFIVYQYMKNHLSLGPLPRRVRSHLTPERINEWMNYLIPILNTDACRDNPYGIVIRPT